MSLTRRTLSPCPVYPLGAHADEHGVRFAVFAGHAEKVEVCLFDVEGKRETARLAMPECTDGIWHGYLPGGRVGEVYGYRVHGPYEPKRGLRFNSHKLLLDPYARQLTGELNWHDALYGYRVGSPKADLSFDRRDSAAWMPKAVVTDEHFDWSGDVSVAAPWDQLVIYELHVKGFTQTCSQIPEHERGSFAGLSNDYAIAHLKRLGVTAVELLPIHTFARDRHLLEKNLTNYWGYNTLSYFAPDRAYGSRESLKAAVKRLHAAGIAVILDVVYNHTCEGNELGPTLSWRGFGNDAYYRLTADDPRYHVNDTGCGNTVNFSHPRVIQMTLDSLRHWASEYHIDGFRFDLGVTLGREAAGFDPGAGLFDALLQDPLLNRLKLISEPWDCGPGGYQIGNHPAGMAEWNGKYRDDLRRYWRGDAGLRGGVAARLQGSAEMFDHHRRRPWACVNFITAHDGFTLHDLVSYGEKHNEANGEDNQDGTQQNESSNWGAEGPAEDEGVNQQRERIKRNFLASVLCSHGTPMLLAGDEFGQTQGGNNNAYCQDNPVSWLNWNLLDTPRGQALRDFTARLFGLRTRLITPRAPYFQHAKTEIVPGLTDSSWFDEEGRALTAEDWENPNGRVLGLRRAAQHTDGHIEVSVLLLNSDGGDFTFKLPAPDFTYACAFDSSDPSRDNTPVTGGEYHLERHSCALLVARLSAEEAARQRL